jgi:hypothetical protein
MNFQILILLIDLTTVPARLGTSASRPAVTVTHTVGRRNAEPAVVQEKAKLAQIAIHNEVIQQELNQFL